MEVVIKDDKCMCCHTKGSKDNPMTVHHVLQQRMKPKDNLLIPLCQACHRDWHSTDINGLKKQLYGAVNHLKSTFQKIERATIGDVFKRKK